MAENNINDEGKAVEAHDSECVNFAKFIIKRGEKEPLRVDLEI